MRFSQSSVFHRRSVTFSRKFEDRYQLEKKNRSCSGHTYQYCVVEIIGKKTSFIEGVLLTVHDTKARFFCYSTMNVEAQRLHHRIVRYNDPDPFGPARISASERTGGGTLIGSPTICEPFVFGTFLRYSMSPNSQSLASSRTCDEP